MDRFTVFAILIFATNAPTATAHTPVGAIDTDSGFVQTLDQEPKQGGHKPTTAVTVRTVHSNIESAMDDNDLVESDSNVANQLLCRDEKVTGSRIKRNRCMTLTEWRKEFEVRQLRSYLAKGAGQPPAWRTP